MDQTHTPEWVSTDEWADVASSVEHMTDSLKLVRERPQEWKWAIIACHSALQGALVCVLAGTDGIGCLTNKGKQDMLAWFETSRTDPNLPAPDPYLASFMELVCRAYNPDAMSIFGGGPLLREESVHRDLKLLNDLRRQFVHFRPASWSIEVTGLPRIVSAGAKLTWRLMFGHPASSDRLDDEQILVFAERFQAASEALCELGAQGFPMLVPSPLRLIPKP